MRISDWSSDVCSSDLPTASSSFLAVEYIAAIDGIDVTLVAFRAVISTGLLDTHVTQLPLLKQLSLLNHPDRYWEQSANARVCGDPRGTRDTGRSSCRGRVVMYV